ncbi:MAG: hypothetical protein ACYCU0_07585 [Solirubrobacteraceae bacterium]
MRRNLQSYFATGPYDGSTAEYITERPTYEGKYRYLTNFGTIPFEAFTNGKDLESFGHIAIHMENKEDKKLLAQPGPLTTSTFTQYHYNCA